MSRTARVAHERAAEGNARRNLSQDEQRAVEALEAQGWALSFETKSFRATHAGLGLDTFPFPTIGEVIETANRLSQDSAGEEAIPAPEPANEAKEHLRLAHEVDLRDALVKWLEGRGKTVRCDVDTPEGVADVYAGDEVYELRHAPTLDDFISAVHVVRDYRDQLNRAGSANVLACCISGQQGEEMLAQAKAKEGICAINWEFNEGLSELLDRRAFLIEDLRVRKAAPGEIISELEAANTLPAFQRLVSDYELQAIIDDLADSRFTNEEETRIKLALDACAERLGATKSADAEMNPASDETDSLFGLRHFAHDELDLLITDGVTQIREGLDDDVVEEYTAKMKAGVLFKAGRAFFDGENYYVSDGFHRKASALKAGVGLDMDVRKGTLRDAILDAVGANADHGLRRSNATKRRAVETLLRDEEWSQWSNREIARRAGVSHEFVATVREELSGSRSQMEVTAQRGETTYTVKTENIGSSPKSAPAEAPSEQAGEHIESNTSATSDTSTESTSTQSLSTNSQQEVNPPEASAGAETTTSLTQRDERQPAAPTVERPGKGTAATPSESPTPSSYGSAAWKKATINLHLQLQPDDGHELGRKVLITGVQEGAVGTTVMKLVRASEIGLHDGPAGMVLRQVAEKMTERASSKPPTKSSAAKKKSAAKKAAPAKKASAGKKPAAASKSSSKAKTA